MSPLRAALVSPSDGSTVGLLGLRRPGEGSSSLGCLRPAADASAAPSVGLKHCANGFSSDDSCRPRAATGRAGMREACCAAAAAAAVRGESGPVRGVGAALE